MIIITLCILLAFICLIVLAHIFILYYVCGVDVLVLVCRIGSDDWVGRGRLISSLITVHIPILFLAKIIHSCFFHHKFIVWVWVWVCMSCSIICFCALFVCFLFSPLRFPLSFEFVSTYFYEHFKQAPSTSKSNTINLVSSVPFRDPTAHISLVSFDLNMKIQNVSKTSRYKVTIRFDKCTVY